MGDPNKILGASNAYLAVANIAGASSAQQQLQGVPLGTVGGNASTELGVKVVVIGGGSGAGLTNVLSSMTVGTVTATTTSGQALDASARKYALIINTGAVDAWLAFGGDDALVGSGVYLKAGGGSYEITDANRFAGVINVIAASSTTNIATTEGV